MWNATSILTLWRMTRGWFDQIPWYNICNESSEPPYSGGLLNFGSYGFFSKYDVWCMHGTIELKRLSWQSTSQQTRYINPMLIQCWASVVDAGPTLDQHSLDVSCSLERVSWSELLIHAPRGFLIPVDSDNQPCRSSPDIPESST